MNDTLIDSIKDDWRMFDGLVEIEYYSRINETTYGSPIAAIALKRMNVKDYELGGQQIEVSLNECIWNTWITSFAQAFVPKRGDKFVAAGVTGVKNWNVLAADYCTFTSRYRLHCKQEDNGS